MKSIGRKVKEFCFKRQRKKLKRDRKLVNLADAENIGILYDASNEDDYIYITKLVRDLQVEHKKVKTIGFIRQKKMPSYGFPKLTFEFCNKKDFKWNFNPKQQVIKEFIEFPFDILIDLTPSDIFQMKYLSALSKAGLIIGRYDEQWKDYYDILIKEKNNCKLEEMVNHYFHYLKMLKN
ncbi:MAG: DUF6913 domain-containing protein [Bacteroidota bacterium]